MFCTSEGPKFSSIAVVTYYEAVRKADLDYGKKSTLFDLKSPPQDIVASPRFP